MDDSEFERFLKTVNAADLHIRSYNYFVTHELPLIVQNFTTTLPIHDGSTTLEFFGASVPPACALQNGLYRPITPFQCRRENSCYMTPIFASIRQTKHVDGHEISSQIVKRVVIAHLPVMVGSCLCRSTNDKKVKQEESETDDGGYFLINGVERVLVTQRRKCYNIPQVLKHDNVLTVNMRSMSKETNHSVLIELSTTSDSDSIQCSLPFVGKKIPIGILVRAFGVSLAQFYSDTGVDEKTGNMSTEDALEYIGSFASKKNSAAEECEEDDSSEEEPEVFDLDLEDEDTKSETSEQTTTTTEPHKLTVKKMRVAYAKQLIDIELFPHIGIGGSTETKYRTICSMARRLLLTKRDLIKPDNIDNLAFHRFEPSGVLLSELYVMLFRNFLNSPKDAGKGGVVTDYTNKLEAFVTKNIKSCMATGKWGIQKASYVRQGVSQVLTRYSVLGTRSHLQRFMLPVGKEGKNVKVRLIHPSHFGYVCLFETPEGQGCGIVLNFTLSVRISQDHSAPQIRDIVLRYLRDYFNETDGIDVWIDSTFVFKTRRPHEFLKAAMDFRAAAILPKETGIYAQKDRNNFIYEIRLLSEKGRVLRPVLDSSRRVIYLDSEEIQNYFIGFTPDTGDFCELHPTLLLSICAGSIPFLDHIQSPRLVYASAMIKQAIGFFATNYPYRFDTTSEVLDYAQKCLVSTQVGRAFGMHDAPAGTNCIVAIMTMGSWNAEDCIVINRAAIERGLFSSTTYKTITVEEYKPKTNDVRRFCVPDESIRKEGLDYSLLDEKGVIKKGSTVSRKHVLVGCVREIELKKGKKVNKPPEKVIEMDCSEIADEEGIVETVDIFESFTGNRMINIVLKIRKIPERGDKFANLNAQKGTCGLIMAPEDMPFCAEDGIIPDILVNPNALPSRMTISMFFELVLGQEACLDGEFRDATPFPAGKSALDTIGRVLHDHGYDSFGWKSLIDGTSGKPLKAKIFMGVNYYQKLKHMVSNKINARNFGNVTISTRQPVSGRSKKGGIRGGEMEVQGWLSHGAAEFLREKLFNCSDEFTVMICNACGIISNHKDQCHICSGELYETNLPYASKIVLQLLQMSLIKTEFHVKLV